MRGDLERDAARAFLQRQGWDTREHRMRAAERYLSRANEEWSCHGSWGRRDMAAGFCWVSLLSWHVYRTPRWTPFHHMLKCCPSDDWEGFLVGFLGGARCGEWS